MNHVHASGDLCLAARPLSSGAPGGDDSPKKTSLSLSRSTTLSTSLSRPHRLAFLSLKRTTSMDTTSRRSFRCAASSTSSTVPSTPDKLSNDDKGGGGAGGNGGGNGGFAIDASGILAGLTTSVSSVVFSISFATLIYSGPGAPDDALSRGVDVCLFSSAVAAFGLGIASRFSGAIGEMQDGPSALSGLIAVRIFADESLSDTAKVATLEACLHLATLGTAAALAFLGTLRLGSLVRVIPSPVLGGFLAGTGWVLLCGSYKVMTGLSADFDGISQGINNPDIFWLEVVPGIAFGASLAWARDVFKSRWIVPAWVICGIATWYAAALVIGGRSPADLLDAGVLLGPLPLPTGAAAANALPLGIPTPLWFDPERFAAVDWAYVLRSLPDLATITALAVTGMLLNVSGIELACGRDANVSYEMQANGLTNLVSSASGALVHYPGLASTKLAFETISGGSDEAAARDRRVFPSPGIVTGAIYMLILALHPDAINYLPRSIVGGILLSLGISFFYEWAIQGATRLPRPEYAVVIIILVAIALFGYLPGVAVGVVSAFVVFVADYSRVPIVRFPFELGGPNPLFSSKSRSKFERAALQSNGQSAYGLVLQGYIFFGTAFRLLEQIRSRHTSLVEETGTGIRWLVLDFRYVVGIDGSAISAINKIRNFAIENDVTIVLTDMRTAVGVDRVVAVIVSGEDLTAGLREIAVSEKQQEKEYWNEVLKFAETERRENKQNRLRVKVLPELDNGLQYVEAKILAESVPLFMQNGGLSGPQLTLQAIVSAVGRTDEQRAQFQNCWSEVEFNEGDVVCRRGDVADIIYFIESAEVQALWAPNVTIEINHNFLGAAGFYSTSGFGAVRFADVVVTRSGRGYKISAEALRDLDTEAPSLTSRFHRIMAAHLADTLISRNKVLAQYQDNEKQDDNPTQLDSPDLS